MTERERDGHGLQRDRLRGREMGIEREQQSDKMGRERERAYKKGLVERNNKIIKKIDYLNKRSDRIDELMWVFCKNGCVK